MNFVNQLKLYYVNTSEALRVAETQKGHKMELKIVLEAAKSTLFFSNDCLKPKGGILECWELWFPQTQKKQHFSRDCGPLNYTVCNIFLSGEFNEIT